LLLLHFGDILLKKITKIYRSISLKPLFDKGSKGNKKIIKIFCRLRKANNFVAVIKTIKKKFP